MWVFVSEIRASHGSAENLSCQQWGRGRGIRVSTRELQISTHPQHPDGVSKRLIRSRVLCLYISF